MPTDTTDSTTPTTPTMRAAAPAAAAAAGRLAVDIPARLRNGGGVQLVGELATMTREAFEELVAAHGGRVIASRGLTRATALVVVGQQGWPLTESGRLPDQLRELQSRARREGRPWTAVVSEEQFVAALGLPAYGEGLRQLYTTATLTDALGVAPETVRGWVKAGLLRPVVTADQVWHFDFRQATAARTLTDLARRGVSLRRMRISLERLRQWLPEADVPLEQVAVLEQDGRLMIRLANGELAEPDGQLHLDFEAGPPPLKMPTARSAGAVSPPPSEPKTAADWFARGVAQEAGGYPAEAILSYRMALRAGGPDARTSFNLANALRAVGLRREAVERYAQAVEIDPDYADAWNNLGTTLAELGRNEEAHVALREALERDADHPLANYNLADVLEEIGRPADAADHWRAYLKHDQTSEWAAYARQRLKGGPDRPSWAG